MLRGVGWFSIEVSGLRIRPIFKGQDALWYVISKRWYETNLSEDDRIQFIWYLILCKTLIRPILTYGSKCWFLSKKDGNLLRIFERITLKLIYGHVNDNGVWRTRYNSEPYILYDEADVVKVVKIGRLTWLGQLFRMQELDPCRKLTLVARTGCLQKPHSSCKNWMLAESSL
jgi:hypothetical protein